MIRCSVGKAVVLLSLLSALGCHSESTGPIGVSRDKAYVCFNDVEGYGNFHVPQSGTKVITSDSEWESFWNLYWNQFGGSGHKTPPPEIDFDHEMVIAVFWGGNCSYSGCTNESPSIESILVVGNTLYIIVGEMADLGPCEMCVAPLHLIRTEKSNLPVRFIGNVP